MTRYPRWRPVCEGDWKRVDFCGKAGAEELARRIRAAWFAAGYDIDVRVVSVGKVDSDHSVFTVRMPDLLNGLAPPWRRIEG